MVTQRGTAVIVMPGRRCEQERHLHRPASLPMRILIKVKAAKVGTIARSITWFSNPRKLSRKCQETALAITLPAFANLKCNLYTLSRFVTLNTPKVALTLGPFSAAKF